MVLFHLKTKIGQGHDHQTIGRNVPAPGEMPFHLCKRPGEGLQYPGTNHSSNLQNASETPEILKKMGLSSAD
jgi:hypothetical protein